MSAASSTKRPGFSVRGWRFRSGDEARAKARQIRDDGEEYASELRKRGEDARAEKVHDAASNEADAIELAASEHDRKATKVAQRPAAQRGGEAALPARSTRRRRSSSSGPWGGGVFGGAGRRAAGAATGSFGDLVEELVIATIVVAFLTVFLNPRGASAFGWLTGGVSRLLELLISPVDPLAGFTSSSAASPAAEAQLAAQTGDTTARRKASPVVVTAGGAGKRGGH